MLRKFLLDPDPTNNWLSIAVVAVCMAALEYNRVKS